MNKIFLYDPASVNPDTLHIMKWKKYVLLELTDNPKDFWLVLDKLGMEDIFVLLSHGDKNGPLPVRGDKGEDINLDRFAKLLNEKRITLYLLSCYTGQDPCSAILLERKVHFVAPIGKAEFQTVGNESIQVFSKTGKEFMGWAGSKGLTPVRASAALSLP
ncbi:MAG: hypothetical protein KGO82_17035 [Bacteroidota bacterium]|nr:hypothetical protein [Bacteroidota bacterium]